MNSQLFKSIVHHVKNHHLRHLTTDRRPILANSLRESYKNVLRIPIRSSTPFVPPPNEYQVAFLKFKCFRNQLLERHREQIPLFCLSTIAALWLLLFSLQACVNQVQLVIHPSNFDNHHISKRSKKTGVAAAIQDVQHKVIVLPSVKTSNVSLAESSDDGVWESLENVLCLNLE